LGYEVSRTLLLLLVLGTLGCTLFAQTITTGTPGTDGYSGALHCEGCIKVPVPEWVPDPSAGHYDCPEGWTAYAKAEPPKFSGIIYEDDVYIRPSTDKKGHVLGVRPPAPICIQDPR